MCIYMRTHMKGEHVCVYIYIHTHTHIEYSVFNPNLSQPYPRTQSGPADTMLSQ